MSAQPSPTSGSAFTDFVFDPSEKLDSLGGPKQRYLSNVAAIKLLKQLEAECRPPGNLTADEQQTLARYCGWGDTEAFNHSCIRKSHYEIEHCGNLKGLLTEAEIISLRASTLNSHYMRLDVIRAIYETIERLGLAVWRNYEYWSRLLESATSSARCLRRWQMRRSVSPSNLIPSLLAFLLVSIPRPMSLSPASRLSGCRKNISTWLFQTSHSRTYRFMTLRPKIAA